jgi:hypothetical protein
MLPATQAEADERTQEHAERLRQQISQNETAQHGLITQLERLGSDTSPAVDAIRQRITDQFTERYNQAKTLQAELETTEAAQPPAQDPQPPRRAPLPGRHPHRRTRPPQAKLYAAFDVQVLYRAHKKQTTIRATITSSIPRIVAVLAALDDTSDNAYGNLANTL